MFQPFVGPYLSGFQVQSRVQYKYSTLRATPYTTHRAVHLCHTPKTAVHVHYAPHQTVLQHPLYVIVCRCFKGTTHGNGRGPRGHGRCCWDHKALRTPHEAVTWVPHGTCPHSPHPTDIEHMESCPPTNLVSAQTFMRISATPNINTMRRALDLFRCSRMCTA